MTRAWLLAILCAAASCDSGYGIEVDVEAEAACVSDARTVTVTATAHPGSWTTSKTQPANVFFGGVHRVVVVPPDGATDVTVEVDLLDASARPLQTQKVDVTVDGHQLFTTAVAFTGCGARDMSGSRDMGVTTRDMTMVRHDMTATGPCMLLPQSGCPGGDKCVWFSGAASCFSDGTTPLGSACSFGSSDTCLQGAMCSPVYEPMCRQLCRSDGDCTQPGPADAPNAPTHCDVAFTNSQGVSLCSVQCDPVAGHASGCGSTYACHVYSNGTSDYTDCTQAGSGGDGAACSSLLQCQSGYGCYQSNGGASHCRPICRAGNNSDCTISGETCVNLTNHVLFGACCPSGGC